VSILGEIHLVPCSKPHHLFGSLEIWEDKYPARLTSCIWNVLGFFGNKSKVYLYLNISLTAYKDNIFVSANSENLAPDSVHKSGLYGLCYGSYHSPLPLFEPTSAAESTTGTWASALVLDRGRALKCTGIIYKTYWAASENRILKESICKDPNVLGRTSSLYLKSSS